MATMAANPLQAFQWQVQPGAEAVVRGVVEEFLTRCPGANRLAERMKLETGTRFFDWIDHVAVPHSAEMERRLREAGFVKKSLEGAEACFVHEGGMFPAVLMEKSEAMRVAIKAESTADFAAAMGIDAPIEGMPVGGYRRMKAFEGAGAALWVVERHGYRGYAVKDEPAAMGIARLRQLELLRTRRRLFDDEAEGFAHAEKLIDAAIAALGVDAACDVFFAAEREYWQRRNRAAQVQKTRQDRLGLGWANHDHHTYRSSRRWFARLIGVLENLGFECRERFYAGREAGWGAQVLEQKGAGVVVFADVDLGPEELMGDFAHEPLAERQELGTVGLWCALHGESFLEAGMHHLECQFDFEALKQQMEQEAGIRVMKPFTNFPYLRQAFTEGERWKVREERLAMLLRKGQITEEQARQFRDSGAIGSHLENLERNQGFKGFNQKGVSEIIAATDPRKH